MNPLPWTQPLADNQLLLCLGSALVLSFLLGFWAHVLLGYLDPSKVEWDEEDFADDHD